MLEARIIKVYCKCGEKLLRYKKRGKGFLIKIHAPRIVEDYAGIFQEKLPEGESVFCPSCGVRFATVFKINGKWVFKINQGALGVIRK